LGCIMRQTITIIAFTVALSVAGQAFAGCESLVGTQVSPIGFREAATALKAMPGPKDEFETSVAYAARVAAARASLPLQFVVSTPLDAEHVKYNADTGAFDIESYAINNINIDWFSAFYDTPYYTSVPHDSSNNIDIVIDRTDRVTGTYIGSNAFGTSARISQIARTSQAIFDSEPGRYGQSLFANSHSDPVTVWHLPMPAEQARSMKGKLKGAVVVTPKAPFYFEKIGSPSGATISDPREVTDIFKIIVADIQCALITDHANTVLISATTN
jgi:hypothetical protein